jgi:hypothetical protein
MMRGAIVPSSPRLNTRDNVVFVSPNTQPNELSVLFLLFILCIAVVILAFVTLVGVSCCARKKNKQETLEASSLQPQDVVPGSSPHLHIMSVAVAVAAPVPAWSKMPKPMMPKSMTRSDEECVLRSRRYDSHDLLALRALRACHGIYAGEDREDPEKAQGLTRNGNDRAKTGKAAARMEG